MGGKALEVDLLSRKASLRLGLMHGTGLFSDVHRTADALWPVSLLAALGGGPAVGLSIFYRLIYI